MAGGIAEDAWLSKRLDRAAFNVHGADGHAVRRHAQGRARAFYHARVPADDVARVIDLGRAGMTVVSATLTLAQSPARPLRGAVPDGVTVRDADPERDGEAAEVARVAFRHDRFHLDPCVPDAAADRVKHDWVTACLAGERGDRLLVATCDGRVVGFLAVLVRAGVHVIDLTAVHPASRRGGAGSALLAACLAGAAAAGADAEVGTQAANAVATRFYEQRGFRARRAALDLHMTVGP